MVIHKKIGEEENGPALPGARKDFIISIRLNA
jgi:hypothetical protein